ncbi:putative disease resistance protein [Prunus yedoensis var. nudiflora]|uniref:Putative disease resistance protein n=1 Tax=Prunus yedoensis var. nudiflora TaxID=2094558 RepID=A0A314XRP0_PRUYE|nr:putative disease resistance protein [Prunus yedoensis var. nudiflora]
MEDIARDCLSELVERCLVQVGTSGSTGTIKGFRIHDLVRDMCLLKAKEESFLQIKYYLQENTSSVAAEATQLGKIRRLAIYMDEKVDRLVSSRDETNGHVRSLLFFGLEEWMPKSEKRLLSPLKDFKMLRVLKVDRLHKREVELPSSTLNRIQSLIVKNDTNSGEEQAMQIVSSCRGIYKLTLDGPIAELPKELHNYPNLTKLVLWSCGLKEDQMRILEKLPNLTILKLLEVFEEKTKILVFSKGGFPSLEVLYVSDMHQITKLRVEEGAMPRLCRLHIQHFHVLTTLPDGLRYLTNLRELTIKQMRRELHCRIQEDGEDFYKIQHIPSLVIGEPLNYYLDGPR